MNTTYLLSELPDLLAAMQAEIAALRARVDLLEGMTPDLLSTEEAAELLELHPNTIKSMIADGRLPASKYGGRNWKIKRVDVLALQERRP